MNQRELSASELSGAFVVRDPQWRQKIFVGGLLLLLCHPLGWPVALGYRKTLIANLASGKEPLLPVWKGNVFYFFGEGLKAMGVIFGYLLPLYVTVFALMLCNGLKPDLMWGYAALFFIICTIFSTLSFPALLFYATFLSSDYRLPLPVSLLLLMLFVLIIFFIPAGFLQVSKTGKYLSAFNFKAAFSTLWIHFGAYCRAWYHSAIMSLLGHFAFPLAPWGVFWCYLSIIYEFNSILNSESNESSSGTWFSRLRTEDVLLVEKTSTPFVFQCVNPADEDPCLLLKLGPAMVPLPGLVASFFCRK